MASLTTYICDSCGVQANAKTFEGTKVWVHTELITLQSDSDVYCAPKPLSSKSIERVVYGADFCSVKCLENHLQQKRAEEYV